MKNDRSGSGGRRLRGLALVSFLVGLPPGLSGGSPLPRDPGHDRLEGVLEPCTWPGVEGEVFCGEIEVPEDRERPDGRRIGLRVVRLPATRGEPATDAITFLAGGGVSPATRLTGFLSRTLVEARRHRDLVLVDQRGTGGSNPLHCPEEPEGAEAASPGGCLRALGETADPRFYTTPHAMDDLDEVRRRLGYQRWTIWGASYGTKAARVYLRRYPGRVRALVLHGVVPLERSMWPEMFVTGQEMLDRTLDRCAWERGCAKQFPALGKGLATIRAQLGEAPLRVPLAPEPGGEPEEVLLDQASLGRALYGALRSVRIARRIPEMIHEASLGNPTPLAESLRSAPGPPLVPRGVYLAIACSEEIARLAGVRVEGPTVLDDGRWLDSEIRACEGWPVGSLPADFWREVDDPDTPALVLSGELDSITPPRYGARIAARLARGRHVVLPHRSHDDVDPCVGRIVDRFLDAADPWALDIDCLAATAP